MAALAWLGLASAFPSAASASPMTFAFSGALESAENLALVSATPFVAGATVQGTFTVETDETGATQVTFGDGTAGRALPVGDGRVQSDYRSGSGATGNLAFSLPCLLQEGCGGSRYRVTLSFPTATDLPETLVLEWIVPEGWSTGTALGDGSLTGLAVRRLVWTIPVEGERTAMLEGTLTTLRLVPEPATLGLLGLGLAGLVSRYGRQRWQNR